LNSPSRTALLLSGAIKPLGDPSRGTPKWKSRIQAIPKGLTVPRALAILLGILTALSFSRDAAAQLIVCNRSSSQLMIATAIWREAIRTTEDDGVTPFVWKANWYVEGWFLVEPGACNAGSPSVNVPLNKTKSVFVEARGLKAGEQSWRTVSWDRPAYQFCVNPKVTTFNSGMSSLTIPLPTTCLNGWEMGKFVELEPAGRNIFVQSFEPRETPPTAAQEARWKAETGAIYANIRAGAEAVKAREAEARRRVADAKANEAERRAAAAEARTRATEAQRRQLDRNLEEAEAQLELAEMRLRATQAEKRQAEKDIASLSLRAISNNGPPSNTGASRPSSPPPPPAGSFLRTRLEPQGHGCPVGSNALYYSSSGGRTIVATIHYSVSGTNRYDRDYELELTNVEKYEGCMGSAGDGSTINYSVTSVRFR
jgi:hypothetical protein